MGAKGGKFVQFQNMSRDDASLFELFLFCYEQKIYQRNVVALL